MKYQSKYSPEKKVTAAQYITEMICEHKAWHDGIELPAHPWKLAETDTWKKYFKSQVPTAHKLLKEFDPRDIIAALNRHDCRNTYSLRSPFLKKLIKEEEKKRKEREERSHEVELGSITEKPKRFARTTRLDLLKELE